MTGWCYCPGTLSLVKCGAHGFKERRHVIFRPSKPSQMPCLAVFVWTADLFQKSRLHKGNHKCWMNPKAPKQAERHQRSLLVASRHPAINDPPSHKHSAWLIDELPRPPCQAHHQLVPHRISDTHTCRALALALRASTAACFAGSSVCCWPAAPPAAAASCADEAALLCLLRGADDDSCAVSATARPALAARWLAHARASHPKASESAISCATVPPIEHPL